LRHTFISNLAVGGVHPKTAQLLARHSTITLTMDRYSHIDRAADAKALEVLPNLDAKGPSGTDPQPAENGKDADPVLALCLARKGRFQATEGDSGRLNADSSAVSRMHEKHRKTRQNREFSMGPVGLEPTRRFDPPTNFKSAASANSATGPQTPILRAFPDA